MTTPTPYAPEPTLTPNLSQGRRRHHPGPWQRCLVRASRLFAAVCLAVLVMACGNGASPEAAGPVESPELGIVLARVPAGFQPAPAPGAGIELIKADGSRLTVDERPVDQAFTLLDIAKEQEMAFLSATDGEFLGARELVAPLGPAYTARGRFSEGGSRIEEGYAYVLMPDASGVLTVLYRYPAGEDSKKRVEELLLVLGELEQLVQESPADY